MAFPLRQQTPTSNSLSVDRMQVRIPTLTADRLDSPTTAVDNDTRQTGSGIKLGDAGETV